MYIHEEEFTFDLFGTPESSLTKTCENVLDELEHDLSTLDMYKPYANKNKHIEWIKEFQEYVEKKRKELR